MSKTMAEVLAEHWFSPADYAYCLCGADMSPDKPVGVHEALAAHQSEALSAAGFGLVADAKAEALEEAAAIFAGRLPNGTGNGRAYNSYQVANMLRARAAALSGES